MNVRLFDLNIEKVLEDWEIEHAIREVIANALDEQLLTETKEIEIKKDLIGKWYIRDFGRGLQIDHFTLNENPEKINSNLGVIGKFGVGLKDALATFYRRDVGVEIRSKFGTFHIRNEKKSGFEEISTLHVEYDEQTNNLVGTEFILSNVEDEKMQVAKSFFIKFSNEEFIDSTIYGQIYSRRNDVGKVYINGVFAAEESNFMFTYNITNLTEAIKRKLNRERLNVGRSTYSGRVKDILLYSENKRVIEELMSQIRNRFSGNLFDELSWIEISQRAMNLLHQSSKVIFITGKETQQRPDLLDWAKRDGLEIVSISEREKEKLNRQMESGGLEIRTSEIFIGEINDSFQYKFVEYKDLTSQEKSVFNQIEDIYKLINLPKLVIPKLLISETMRITNDDTGGIWDPSIKAIVLKRTQLSSLNKFAGTLLHETGHIISGASDCTRAFENILTEFLGKISEKALNNGQ